MATEIVNYKTKIVSMTSISAVVLWILSEYFSRRRRMVAPAITERHRDKARSALCPDASDREAA